MFITLYTIIKMLEIIRSNGFPRDYLVRENKNNKIVYHTSNTDVHDFNIYAKN